MNRHLLELLAPAKTAEIGIAAVDHGADAVYIGGPAFGARHSASNTIADIERLCTHAHRYHAQIFVTLNTILHDNEIEPARRLAWEVFEAGADALIVQDMGLLEVDLPPLPLHASTQCDIRSAAKARFLQDAGFSQLVLARELSINDVAQIAAATTCRLEYFIHGALCVAFSGQCYISHAHTGRSANRGECSQACRLPYDLADQDGRIIARDQHLLSMKDNNQSANLAALAAAGVSAFKIEGRYKDLAYVKNLTAHYRQLLDAIIDHPAASGQAGLTPGLPPGLPPWQRASSGRCAYSFVPDANKTFNRGYTDYFTPGRQHGIEAFESPTFVGSAIGQVSGVDRKDGRFFDCANTAPLANGDGLSWYDHHGELTGVRSNRIEHHDGFERVFLATRVPASLVVGTALFRNHDQAFEAALAKPSATRRIALDTHFSARPTGCRLTLCDEDGISASVTLTDALSAAHDPERAAADIRKHLGKLGASIFSTHTITLDCADFVPFLPVATLNALRREAVEELERARLAACIRPSRALPLDPPTPYPTDTLDYLANVLNASARAFYARHGVKLIEAAFEANANTGHDEVSLMVTRHCLRYSTDLCPKEVKGVRPEPMQLIHGNDTFTLRFDCKRCEMHILGRRQSHIARLKKEVAPQAISFYPQQ
ncbi:protease [Betaproteobacteria bacterium]|nr:protease [Betaproteobacteria bacterium]GHU03841.1 protease [Betaproteobacteria bacterium]